MTGAGPSSRLRCLVVGIHPEPDLDLVRRLAKPVEVELVVPPAGEGTAALGQFDCMWRLFGGWGGSPDPVGEALQSHPELRWVHTVSAGIDRLGEHFTGRPGVALTTSAGVTAIPIAEFVVGCMLQHCKRYPEIWELQRQRRFEQLALRELSDLKVVILGMGAIGTTIARLLQPFGCELIGARRRPGLPGEELVSAVYPPAELGAACHGADALVLAAPLTQETRGIVDEKVLSRLADGSCLVNIARGGLAKEAVLLEQLRSGPLAAAYLDAFEQEPLPPESPLWSAPGAFLSSHCSWRSPNFSRRSSELFGEQLRRFGTGQPLLNVSHPAWGY
jgi:phosphoglycerate dehydrogenase-like enzyme